MEVGQRTGRAGGRGWEPACQPRHRHNQCRRGNTARDIYILAWGKSKEEKLEKQCVKPKTISFLSFFPPPGPLKEEEKIGKY
mgnify:CR=1 FL=1